MAVWIWLPSLRGKNVGSKQKGKNIIWQEWGETITKGTRELRWKGRHFIHFVLREREISKEVEGEVVRERKKEGSVKSGWFVKKGKICQSKRERRVCGGYKGNLLQGFQILERNFIQIVSRHLLVLCGSPVRIRWGKKKNE